jgi:hypothetical protein
VTETYEVIEWPMRGGNNWVVANRPGYGYTPLQEFPAGFRGKRDAEAWRDSYVASLDDAKSKQQPKNP